MSFVQNNAQQISISDSYLNLTEREKRILDKSWAKVFSEEVFPRIDERPYAVLYSSKDSRPNTPINVIIGALIIKELTGLTDEELVESILFDIRYQYALRTTSFKEQPVSDRTFSRFRERCAEHEMKTGDDLLKGTIKNLSEELAKLLKINSQLKRMDSMMIASNIKRLSRMELFYSCVTRLVSRLKKEGCTLPERYEHYLSDSDRNETFYYMERHKEEKFAEIVQDAIDLETLSPLTCRDMDEYKILKKLLDEQTKYEEDGVRYLKDPKKDKIEADSLQSPMDPDATYRTKAGKAHTGYVGNIVESVGERSRIITDYQLETNVYSDQQFCQDQIDASPKTENPTMLVADGAFGSKSLRENALKKNIHLLNTGLNVKDIPDFFSSFELDAETKTKIVKCPGGFAPDNRYYNETTKQRFFTLPKNCCDNCPFNHHCKPKFMKNRAGIRLTLTKVERALIKAFYNTKEYFELAHIRNGSETVPSVLRRKYNVDRIPQRGLIRMRFWFGLKIMAANFTNFFRHKRLGLSC